MNLPRTGKQWLGLLIVLFFLGIAMRQIVSVYQARDDYFNQRDFVSDYLTARAALAGTNIYTPLPELGQQFGLPLPPRVFEHPSPHPPFLILFSTPLGWFSPYAATAVWMVIGVVCLFFCVRLLANGLSLRLPLWSQLVLTLLVIGWPPIASDLYIGQMNLPLLLLLLNVWLALRRGQWFAGGVLLGCGLALKLIIWPLAVYLLLRRQWRAVMGAALSFLSAHALAAAVFGVSPILHYYTKVGAPIAAYYRDAYHNQALAGWGWRMFSGLGKHYGKVMLAPPLLDAVLLAKIAAVALPLCLVMLALWWAWHARSFDTAFALLLNVSLLAAPVCWIHYFVLMCLPLALVVKRYRAHAQPLPFAAQGLFVLMSLPFPVYVALAKSSAPIVNGIPLVSFAAGCLTLLPALGVLGWLWVLWGSDVLADALVETVPDNFSTAA